MDPTDLYHSAEMADERQRQLGVAESVLRNEAEVLRGLAGRDPRACSFCERSEREGMPMLFNTLPLPAAICLECAKVFVEAERQPS